MTVDQWNEMHGKIKAIQASLESIYDVMGKEALPMNDCKEYCKKELGIIHHEILALHTWASNVEITEYDLHSLLGQAYHEGYHAASVSKSV